MFLSADTMAYLCGLGLSGDQLVELVRRLDADALSVAPVKTAVDPMREKKRERDRERYRSRNRGENGAESDAENVAENGVEIAAKTATGTTAKDAHTRGENNLSRLVDPCPAAAVVAEAREPICDWPDGDANHHAKLLASLAGASRLDPARQPGLATTAGRLAAWKRDGASWTYDVVPAVTIMSQKRGPPIATWKYFDPAIAQSIADNRRALEIPQANGPRHERPDQPSAKFAAKQANMERSLRGAEIALARRAF